MQSNLSCKSFCCCVLITSFIFSRCTAFWITVNSDIASSLRANFQRSLHSWGTSYRWQHPHLFLRSKIQSMLSGWICSWHLTPIFMSTTSRTIPSLSIVWANLSAESESMWQRLSESTRIYGSLSSGNSTPHWRQNASIILSIVVSGSNFLNFRSICS